MLSLRLALFLALGAILAYGGDSGTLSTIVFSDGSGDPVELRVEIADTPEKLIRGLMFREQLPEEQGMLFDFGTETESPFWMKDTSIPLSIAFISADGLIVDIQDMQPLSTDLHKSDHPYTFAVEVNQGWFQRHDIQEGSRVELPPRRSGRAP